MKTNMNQIRKRLRYTDAFKKELVAEFEKGRLGVTQLSRLHGMAPQNLYRWIYKYSTFNEKSYRIVEMKESTTEKLKQLEAKVKELEQAVGRKQITIDYLEKMIDLAGSELSIDIKKNYATPHSAGFGTTKRT